MGSDQEPAKPDDALDYDAWSWSKRDEVKEAIHTLISHHPPSLYGHCIRVTVLGRSVYFCSRCTGIYGGMAVGIVALLFLGVSLSPDWIWFMLALILGFATVTDWMTQRLTPRKTRNSVRFISGLMSGLGLAIVFLLANLVYMLITLGIMMGSVGLVGVLENKLKRTDSRLVGREPEEPEEEKLDIDDD
jgi:uncharacterized membrane protein